MPRAAKTSVAWARKWCRIPAPAPCASTYNRRASCGRTSKPSSVFANEVVETLEHTHELGLCLEHFDDRVVAELLHPLQRIHDRPVAVVELAVHLVPFDGHRHRRTGAGPHTVGRHHQLTQLMV